MKISIHQIKQSGAQSLIIHSYESGIYLVEAKANGDTGFVTDDSGNYKRFNSVNQVKDEFHGSNIGELWLVEESAYEEMIGLMQQDKTQLRIPLSLH